MAVTGVVLFGFVVAHVAGNLLIFAGEKALNNYSAALKANPAVLWGARLVLLASVAAHIGASIRLTRLKESARPVAYEGKKPHGSTYASRTMMWSGPVVAAFVVYHLLHFTTGHAHPDARFESTAVFHNVVVGFGRPLASLIYVVAMLALGLHLSHGAWSMLQTVGANRPHLEPLLRRAAIVVSALIIAGFISIPLAVLAGIVKL
jgi:succinate dehydrogenase / fumarate reductase cytochrome b subunit